MSVKPNQSLSESFQPGLGDQHVLGASGLGMQMITATLAANTARTAAQLIASPPNTANHNAFGPVVHSLGVPPSAAWAQVAEVIAAQTITYQYVTADNSAIYFNPVASTANLVGVATRIFVVR